MRAKTPYKKSKKRVGCGTGSGHGKTSCRGQKGQRSRSGFSQRAGFEGGQNPLYRRLPKRGFSRVRFQEKPTSVNVGLLEELKEKEVTPEILVTRGVVKKLSKTLKVLGNGDVKSALTVKAHYFSVSAKEKIEKAGGKAIVLEQFGAKPETKTESKD